MFDGFWYRDDVHIYAHMTYVFFVHIFGWDQYMKMQFNYIDIIMYIFRYIFKLKDGKLNLQDVCFFFQKQA